MSLFGASGILKDETLDLLSSVGPISSRTKLSETLADQWKWEAKYGDELFRYISRLPIPPFQELPKKPRAKKRALEGEVDRNDK